MGRACSICQNPKRAEIDRRVVSGETVKGIAKSTGVAAASLFRHRRNCMGMPSSNSIVKEASRATAIVASLPSKGELGCSYDALSRRIDAIVVQAEATGSLGIALAGLKELRATLDSVGRLIIANERLPAVSVQVNATTIVGDLVGALLPHLANDPEAATALAAAAWQLTPPDLASSPSGGGPACEAPAAGGDPA